MKTILQVALDLLNAPRAITIATAAKKGGADWLEVGTPLIKSEGMDIIRRLKQHFPTLPLVADMKTMDTGALETEMAAKAGADVVCILAASDDSTITDAIRSGKKYGAKIMVDFIGIHDKLSRAQQIEPLGADYFCVHVGIDEQMIGKKPLEELTKFVQSTNVPVAVAGGINSETASDMVHAGASIIIVGGAITKAQDVTQATRLMKQAIAHKKPIDSSLFKKYDASHLQEAFSLVSTPNISDALHKEGAMEGIRPIKQGFHMVGKALTVRTLDGDWAKPIEAIDKAAKSEVIVVDVKGGKTAIWGELASWSAKSKGLSGVVIDGAVRDLDDLVLLDLPIFCRHVSSNAGEPKGLGEIGVEILCGGQRVRSGDWIIGDDSGVVVVPQEIAQEIANRALHVKETENRIREEIKQGGSLGTVVNVKKWEKIIE
jgi:3-hexulose-6-phosphate synthase/6-phospho-3-hexuloisomerase